MSHENQFTAEREQLASQAESQPVAEQRISEIASLIRSLDETAQNSGRSETPPNRHENQLIQVRLGVASSLFMALRCKHAPTAAHCMRVALGCSAWMMTLDLEEKERDCLEVAALLHDVGKIGIPDHILQKFSDLNQEETAIMNRHPQFGEQILSCCAAPPELLDIVRYAGAWYDGSKPGYDKYGEDIPLGARIVAIVDAFDAMTTDHVYRRAFSRERALVELYEFAGKQFDPELVRSFGELHERNQIDLYSKVSQRWLEALAPELSNQTWQLNTVELKSGQAMSQSMFQQKLLDNMHDGVVFVDSQLQIFLWNQGAERLSRITSDASYQRKWTPSLVELRDDRSRIVKDSECPVAQAIESGVQSLQRMSIAGRNGIDSPIDLHAIPVVGRDGTVFGATLLLHDASNETTLEERCQNLHSQATKDLMTQVTNRAEFDRVHKLFLDAHAQSNLPCSLVICDIDHFKSVNDNYGHQAGDEAIKIFASLLQNHARHGDLVARYGGEEFVVLFADCDTTRAVARTEKIRRELSDTPQPMLGSKRITASFGLTQFQSGDTPEIMLRRADRALYEAKIAGRNQTVQLGSGTAENNKERRKGWWPFRRKTTNALIQTNLASNVPIEVIIEKLRGFIADHDANILSTSEDKIELSIEGTVFSFLRRKTDRAVPFFIEILFSSSSSSEQDSQPKKNQPRTRMSVTIRPQRNRDRRVETTTERARTLLNSLKSYLIAHEEVESDEDTLSRAKKSMKPFLK